MPPAAVVLVGAALASSAAYSAGIVIFGTVLVEAGWAAAAITFAAVAAVGFATMSMQPKPPKPNIPNFADSAVDRTRMIRQPITARRMVYGWMRVSGPQTFLHTTSNNDLLHVVLTLATHRVSRLDALLLNDEVVPLDGNGDATGNYAGYVSAFLGLGTTAGDATFHSELTADVTASKWGSTHLQTGCAKLYIKLTWNADKFKGGSLPNISVIIRGKDDIVDSRDASTGWTDNAALCIADWLKSEFGYGWPSANIDDTALDAAANVCDEIQARNPGYTFTAAASDVVTCSSVDMPTGFAIYATTTNTLPGGMSLNTAYYWIRLSATTGNIATSKANALAGTKIDITDAGTGTHTLRGVTTFTVDASTDITTVGDTVQRLRTGTRVNVVSSNTLPAGLSAATDYYWIAITGTTGKFATSLANSRAGTAINITDAGTGTHLVFATGEPRYTLNGTIDTSQDAEDLLRKLLSAMAGMRVTSGKTITLYAGAWRAPTVTINEDDLAGGVSIQTRNSRRDLFNGVKGVFSSPDDLWQPTDFPPIQVAAYVTQDQEIELWREADLPFTNSPTMAQRIVRIDLERNRRQISGSWPCKLTALRILGADVINVDHTRFGWDNKTFEVGSWKFVLRNSEGGSGPSLGCDLTLKEIDSAVYTWTPGTDELVMKPAQTTTLPDPFTVAAPTSLTLTSGATELFLREDGTVFTRIKVTWTAPADSFVTSGGIIEMQWKKTGDSVWETGPNVPGDATTNWILDVEDGVSYDVRVRSSNVLGVKSAYTTVTGHTVVGKTAAPENVTNFVVQQNGVTVVFKWNQVSDIDLSGYEIRFMRSPFVWEDANVLTAVTRGTQVTSAAVPPSPTDADTGAQVAWVFGIKARDTSENYSATAATFSLVVSNSFDVISENEQRPLWPGTTGFVVAVATQASGSGISNLFGIGNFETLTTIVDTASAITAKRLAYSPNGSYVALTLTQSRWLDVFRTDTYQKITDITSYPSAGGAGAQNAKFSPNGSYLAVGHVTTPFVTIYRVDTWAKLTDPTSLPTGAGFGVSFSSNGSLLAVTHINSPFITVYNVNDWSKVTPPDSSPADGVDGAFTPNNSYFVLAHTPISGENFRVYAVNSWTHQTITSSYVGNQGNCVAFSSNGSYMALGTGGSGLTVYAVNSWSRVGINSAGTGTVEQVAFTSDNAYLLAAFGTAPFFGIYETNSWVLINSQFGFTPTNTGHVAVAITEAKIGLREHLGFIRNPMTGNLNPASRNRAVGNDFNVFNSYVYNPVSEAVYEASEINLTKNLSTRIWADIGANLGPVSSGSANYQLQIDYKTSTGSYDGFEDWTVGEVASVQNIKARIVSNMSSGQDVTRLTSFNLTADAAERTERAENVAVASGGSTINFTAPFALTPGVRLSNATANANFTGLGTITTSGFVGHVFSASGTNIGGTVNWEAVGV